MPTTATTECQALQVETVLSVSEGVVCLVLDEDETVLLPGDEAVIPCDVPYRYWDAGDIEAEYSETLRAAASV
jgi:hypothetical protein